jgi:hypothetical protein
MPANLNPSSSYQRRLTYAYPEKLPLALFRQDVDGSISSRPSVFPILPPPVYASAGVRDAFVFKGGPTPLRLFRPPSLVKGTLAVRVNPAPSADRAVTLTSEWRCLDESAELIV